MAIDPIIVRFSSNNAALNAGAAAAEAAINKLQGRIEALAAQMVATGQIGNTAMNQWLRNMQAEVAQNIATLEAMGATVTTVGAQAAAASASIGSIGAHAASTGPSLAFMTRELRALADEAASGRWRNFDGTLVNIIGHSSGLISAFVTANPVFSAFAVAVTAAGAALAFLTFEEARAQKTIDILKASLAFSGNAQLSSAAIAVIGQKIFDLAGPVANSTERFRLWGATSVEEAQKIAVAIGAIPGVTDDLANAIVAAGATIATELGEKPTEAIGNLVKVLTQASPSVDAVAKSLSGLTNGQRDEYETALASGDANKARAAILDILAQKLRSTTAEEIRSLQAKIQVARATVDANHETMASEGDLSQSLIDQDAQLTGQINQWQKLIDTMKGAADGIAAYSSKVAAVPQTMEQVRLAGEKAAEGFGDTKKLEDLNRKILEIESSIKSLQAGGAGGISPEIAKEAEQAQSAVDVLTQKVSALSDKLASAIADGSTKSITNLREELRTAVGDLDNAKTHLADFTKPQSGDADIAHLREQQNALADMKTKRQELLAVQQGGTESQKLEAEQAAQNAVKGGDALTQAQARLAVAQQQLALDTQNGLTAGKITADQAAVTKATKDVTEAKNAEAAAAAKVSEVSAKSLGDAKAIYDTEIARIALLRSETSDRSKQTELDAEAIQAQTTYNNAVRQITLTANQGIIADEKATTKQREAVLNELLQTHQITSQVWLQQTIAALDAEQDKFQDIADEEKKLAGTTGEERLRIETALKSQLGQIADQEKQAQIKAAEEASKAWDAVTKQINSDFTGQINGLLTGTETWHKAFLNVLKDLTEQMIKLGVDKVLTGGENLVKSALGVGQVAGDAAGNAGLIGSNSILMASINALTVAMGGSIPVTAANTAASAANTGGLFAGIGAFFANTASTIGNTAATIAQTAFGFIPGHAEGTPFVQSTGLALIHKGEAIIPANVNPFPHMDTGGYVNSSGMAMIHAGETVQPAGVSQPYQGGGDTHVHLHMPAAIDSGSVRDWFHDNAAHVASALSKAVGNGNHLALKGLGAR